MKHFYKPLLLLLTTAVLLLGGCGVQQTASEQEKNITAENNAVVLAAGRNLAPGEKDGYYCSKILGVWEPLITKDENGLPKPCLATGWEMKDGGEQIGPTAEEAEAAVKALAAFFLPLFSEETDEGGGAHEGI